jgi:hypothetical protein
MRGIRLDELRRPNNTCTLGMSRKGIIKADIAVRGSSKNIGARGGGVCQGMDGTIGANELRERRGGEGRARCETHCVIDNSFRLHFGRVNGGDHDSQGRLKRKNKVGGDVLEVWTFGI